MGATIHYTRPDGRPCQGYYASPASRDRAAGIVVIQEWWGVNDQIKGVAERLVAMGYRALVPDLYRGEVTVEAAEAEHLMNGLDFMDATTQDIQGAVDYLRAGSAKVAITGFCMGGALAILSAVRVQGLSAAVAWYGFPPAEAADVRDMAIPLLGHFAEQDEFFPIAGVDALEARLQAANVACEIHRYPCRHAFANETRQNYDPEAAALAWRRTAAFLGTHLA